MNDNLNNSSGFSDKILNALMQGKIIDLSTLEIVGDSPQPTATKSFVSAVKNSEWEKISTEQVFNHNDLTFKFLTPDEIHRVAWQGWSDITEKLGELDTLVGMADDATDGVLDEDTQRDYGHQLRIIFETMLVKIKAIKKISDIAYHAVWGKEKTKNER